MVQGIKPREASDRLTVFQARFDELYRKFETYTGGEELFGIAITGNLDDLLRIKKELNYLQKLYGLYDLVRVFKYNLKTYWAYLLTFA